MLRCLKDIRLVVMALGCLAAGIASSNGQNAAQVKAAFIPKLAAFVTWPSNTLATAEAPLVVGVLGVHSFGRGFEKALAASSARGRRLEFKQLWTAAEATNCHMVFLPADSKPHVQDLLSSVAGRAVLTVADVPGFAEEGGMINFAIVGGKVRFEINRAAAAKAGLVLDARLLGASRIVAAREESAKGAPR